MSRKTEPNNFHQIVDDAVAFTVSNNAVAKTDTANEEAFFGWLAKVKTEEGQKLVADKLSSEEKAVFERMLVSLVNKDIMKDQGWSLVYVRNMRKRIYKKIMRVLVEQWVNDGIKNGQVVVFDTRTYNSLFSGAEWRVSQVIDKEEQMDPELLTKMHIAKVGISFRTAGSLFRYGVRTLNDLLVLPLQEVLTIPGITKTSFRELERFLEKHGIEWPASNERESLSTSKEKSVEKSSQKVRGFELVSDYQDEDLLPKRGTAKSAGYDFKVAEDITIAPGEIALVKTGIKAYMGDDEVLSLYDRSSNARKQGLVLINSVGIIDSDYYNNADNEGHIMAQLYNITKAPVSLSKGERIVQGVFTKYLIADDDEATGRRVGGFGSTDESPK